MGIGALLPLPKKKHCNATPCGSPHLKNTNPLTVEKTTDDRISSIGYLGLNSKMLYWWSWSSNLQEEPIYMIVSKDHDHEIVSILETHPKVMPMEFKVDFCVLWGLQCSVKHIVALKQMLSPYISLYSHGHLPRGNCRIQVYLSSVQHRNLAPTGCHWFVANDMDYTISNPCIRVGVKWSWEISLWTTFHFNALMLDEYDILDRTH